MLRFPVVNLNLRKPLEFGVKPKGRSFACKHLQMVKIKCSKDDARIHKLAFLFRASSVPVEKIFVVELEVHVSLLKRHLYFS